MRRIVAATGTLLATAAATAVLSAGAAQAAPIHTPVLLGSFQLTKTDVSGNTTTASLNCVRGVNVYGQTYVDGNGTVTDPTAACQELAAVDGDFSQLLVHPTWLTTALVAPVSVSASGTWLGTADDWSHTYRNGSEVEKFTGDVFQF